MTTVIRRPMGKPAGRVKNKDKGKTYVELSPEDKFKVITMYAEGKDYKEIGRAVGCTGDIVTQSISVLIKELTIVQESRKLSGHGLTLPLISKSSEEITKDFISLVKDNGMIYAYYMGLTNDSKYALKAAGLDKMPPNIKSGVKNFIIRMRSQYLRSIPEIRVEIDLVRKEELKNSSVDKPYIVTEIVSLLEQEKIRSADEPSARKNAITLVKMLGDTCGAFTTNIKFEEIDSNKSLEMLIEMAKEDVGKEIAQSTYAIEDIDDEE